MDEIKKLLQQTQLDEHTELTIVSIFGGQGVQSAAASESHIYTSKAVANSIIGKDVFVSRHEEVKPGTLKLPSDLQLYADKETNTVYLFLDAAVNMSCLISTLRSSESNDTAGADDMTPKTIQKMMTGHQSATMRGFLLMLLVSHLIIPVLPASMLTSDMLSTLVTLSQAKHGIFTHLAQFQTHCWKHWDIPVPWTIFEKKEAESRRERERLNAQVTGWWGPAKGVPLMVFVLTNVPIPNVENTNRSHLPVFMKKLQESLQTKLKYILRSTHLIPAPSESNAAHSNLEFKSLFCLPNDQYPFMHIMPAIPSVLQPKEDDKQDLHTFNPSPSNINAYLSKIDYFATDTTLTSTKAANDVNDSISVTDSGKQGKSSNKDKTNKHQVAAMLNDYGTKFLSQFVSHWIKVAKSRNPMHVQVLSLASTRRQEVKQTNVPLPDAFQFFSALVPLLSLVYGLRYSESNHDDFKKLIMADNRSTKGMVQQIEVILRKKIKNTVEIEKVFSRSHSQGIMQKCLDAYIQDSPPYYTQKYHLSKSESVLKLYNSLSRGPSASEFAVRLERECDSIWRQGRQSCEAVSLTGKACRLKNEHGRMEGNASEDDSSSTRDERALTVDTKKHNSGYSFTHACSCGRSRRAREDPFDLETANYSFYEKSNCCLAEDHKAIDLQASVFGDQQHLVYNEVRIPRGDACLLYLGPASTYRNTVGLERYEGFTENTSYLLPWSLTTVSELEAKAAKGLAATDIKFTEQGKSMVQSSSSSNTDWPALGKHVEASIVKSPVPSAVSITNMEGFPSLTSANAIPNKPASTLTSIPTPASSTPAGGMTARMSDMKISSSKSTRDERRKERRRRDGKRGNGYRLEGQIRGFLGAEYECPNGHRFLSCGDGRVCKLGHKGHPKGHGNHFVHQDLPLYALCPCNFADYGHTKMNLNKIAQLQRLYVVCPDADVSIVMKPVIKIKQPGTSDYTEHNLGINAPLTLPKNGVYVLRLPFIYTDPKTNQALAVEMDIEKRLKSAFIEKECFRVDL